jgi:hypothetical protein
MDTSKECIQPYRPRPILISASKYDGHGVFYWSFWNDKCPEQLIALLDRLLQQGIRPSFLLPLLHQSAYNPFRSQEEYHEFLRVVLNYPSNTVYVWRSALGGSCAPPWSVKYKFLFFFLYFFTTWTRYERRVLKIQFFLKILYF